MRYTKTTENIHYIDGVWPKKRKTYRKILFLDRDGVINYDFGYVHTWEHFKFIPGVFEFLQYISHDYDIVIITNQSGIARGFYSIKDFVQLTVKMLKVFESKRIRITRVYFCPHISLESIDYSIHKCTCRKPMPGMIEHALRTFGVSAQDCLLVGDKKTDIIAGESAGINKNYLIAGAIDKQKKIADADNLISLLPFIYPNFDDLR